MDQTRGQSGGELHPSVNDFIGKRVQVFFTAGQSDIGIVEYIDSHWVRLRSGDETLLIPIRPNVRLIKTLD